MTAFAISFQRDRAVIAADSLGYIPDRKQVIPLGFISKILTLPQQRAVLFSRGQCEVAVRAVTAMQMRPDVWTVEDLAAALPDAFREITRHYCHEHGIADPLGVGLLEAVLIGWSADKRRMRLWQFMSYQNYVAIDAGDMTVTQAFPRLPANYMPRVAGPATDAQLVQIIQAAGRYFEDEPEINCGCRVGGEVLSVELTERGMTQRILHRFENYDELRTASAAIVARIERGDMDVEGIVAEGLVPIAEVVDAETGKPLTVAAKTAPAASAVAGAMTRQQRRAAEREAAKGQRAA